MFALGMHHPHQAWQVPLAFVSINALRKRVSAFMCRRVIIDSGAFTTIHKYGCYPEPVEEYAGHIRRFKMMLGRRLLAAIAQDYMCESVMLAKTGLSIADHQRLTIDRYDALLRCDVAGCYIMPVLQGYAPDDYVAHIQQYGARLKPRMWVGVGSVCKRNGSPAAVLAVLAAIKTERPDLRLHGFGLKLTALTWLAVVKLLFSADSMAWSFNARRNGRDANNPAEAVAYRARIMPLLEHNKTKIPYWVVRLARVAYAQT